MPRSWKSQIADEVRATSMMKPKWPDDAMAHIASLQADNDLLRQLLSEADKREKEAKRIAVNAETYGYGHGLEAAAKLARKMQDDALTDSAREHAGHFEEAIRALQSEER